MNYIDICIKTKKLIEILATIIDNFWLVTSNKCCLNKDSFRVVWDDGSKSQWIFFAKKRQKSCTRKKFCPKMYPRNHHNTDICLLELTEDLIETGRRNNLLLRSICLPESETLPGSSCYTSGINRESKDVDAVPLNLLSDSLCDNAYNHHETEMNVNQLCAGIPSNNNLTAPFNDKYGEDFGGPLICLNSTNQSPIFTGVSASSSFSKESGYPGIYTNIFKNKDWIRNMTGTLFKIIKISNVIKQLGRSGQNVLVHASRQDAESVLRCMDVTDWSTKNENAPIQMIDASSN